VANECAKPAAKHLQLSEVGRFAADSACCRLEIRAKGQAISEPISASYGYETGTGNVQMKTAVAEGKALEANTLTLLIAEEGKQKTVSVHFLDVISGVELAKLGKIEYTISL
jgi:hypothetical protein